MRDAQANLGVTLSGSIFSWPFLEWLNFSLCSCYTWTYILFCMSNTITWYLFYIPN